MFNILKVSSALHLERNPSPSKLKRSKKFFLFDTKLFGNAGKCREACCRINSKSIRSVLESLIRTQITVNLVCHGTLICNISRDITVCQPYQIRNWAARSQKVWNQTEILSSNIRYFVVILRFVTIYTLLERLKARKVFGQKKCFMGKKCTIT